MKNVAFVGKQRVPYLDEGPHGTIPVVFLHGWGLAPWAYRGMLTALARNRRVVSPFLPSLTWNRSVVPLTSHRDLARLVGQFCADRGIERAHIAGQSTGGGVATCLASMHPGLAVTLTLMDSSGVPTQTPCNLSLARLARAVLLDIGRQFLDPRYPVAQTRMAASFFANLAGARMQLIWAASIPLYDDLTTELQRLDMPVQILCGTRAVMFPPAAANYMQTLVRASKLHLVDGGFHLWEAQQPELAADLILAFIRQTEAASART